MDSSTSSSPTNLALNTCSLSLEVWGTHNFWARVVLKKWSNVCNKPLSWETLNIAKKRWCSDRRWDTLWVLLPQLQLHIWKMGLVGMITNWHGSNTGLFAMLYITYLHQRRNQYHDVYSILSNNVNGHHRKWTRHDIYFFFSLSLINV